MLCPADPYVTADQEGHGRTHGSDSPKDMQTPWVDWGKGVMRGFTISAPANSCDTAATALWLLNMACPLRSMASR